MNKILKINNQNFFKILKKNLTNLHNFNKEQDKILVNFNKRGKFVWIKNYDNKEYNFPSIWLRDNCQCDKCFHKNSTSRIIDWENFNLNTFPIETNVNDEKYEIEIKWSDNHLSIYCLDWLIERNFSYKDQVNYLNEYYRPKKKLWNRNDFKKILHSFKFNDIIDSDKYLKEWLECLAIYGVALIKDTPNSDKECRKLANRVGFIRRTHYGEEFIVTNKPSTTNVAYLSTPLQLHTDLPYYEYKPGVNLLHCMVQSNSDGAENVLSDGFYVAEKMKLEYPQMYKLLSKILVDWHDIGEEDGNKFHSINRSPVICEGYDGRIERINYSTPQRDSHFTIPINLVNDWYEALSKFVKLLHNEKIYYKLNVGDILTFDNIRLVHGRTGYEDTTVNQRYIIGAYLDWDEIYSRLRVLHK